MTPGPEVSVVIPYFDDPDRLRVLLRALDQQAGGVRFEAIVADDGSPVPPPVPDGLGFACTVVRQPDLGFRAAAAHNLGAERAAGEFLLFLDADTLPTATYLRAMVDRLRAIDEGHGVLVVGRRRHAALGGVPAGTVLAFLRTGGEPPPVIGDLGEPRWLRDGYARTADLHRSGDEDFRLVISAVLGVDRRVWAAAGGFDPSFVGYGGEDWDLAWRAWLAGADRAHAPDAVAWHDGPDAAGRGADPATKNAESLRLARRIPLPSVRGRGLVLDRPEIAVRYLGPTTGTADDAAVVACVGGLLRSADAGVWFPGRAAAAVPPLLAADPRVHAGEVPPEVIARARHQVRVHRPVRLALPLDRCCALGEWDVPGLLRIRRTRSTNRGGPVPTGVPAAISDGATEPAVQVIPPDVSLERWWAGW